MSRNSPQKTGGPKASQSKSRPKTYIALAGGAIAFAVVALLAVVVLSGSGSGPTGQAVVQGRGGTWTNVTPDRLTEMLVHKDFTFLNVKTPYIGEIEGTDLYIPYDQLPARAAELPTSKSAGILVYCRSGAESAIAAQTLLDLGYEHIWNLDGGMNAWQSSGRTLVQKNR